MTIDKDYSVGDFATSLSGTGSASPLFTVNTDALVDNPRLMAAVSRAFGAWSSFTGLTFKYVHGDEAAQIRLTHEGDTISTVIDTLSDPAHPTATINLDDNLDTGAPKGVSDWGKGYGGFQVILHQIGLAIGLNEGATGTYQDDAAYTADSWQYSVMSAFKQSDADGSADVHLTGPMMADIMAVKDLFGPLDVNAGNTVYGAGSKLVGGWTDFGLHPELTYCINDSHGHDTIDISNAISGTFFVDDFTGESRLGNNLDLRSGHFSDIGDLAHNLSIAPGTIIEDAIGSAASDRIVGNEADNTIHGMRGSDVLYGGGGDDRLYGEDDNDTLDGGAGADLLNGGAGRDTASYLHAEGGVIASLMDSSMNTGEATGDHYVSIENLTGSSFDDVLVGDATGNMLVGGLGDDILYGAGGHDSLIGAEGADVFVFGKSFGADVYNGNAAIDGSDHGDLTDYVFDFSHAEGDRIVLSLQTYSGLAGSNHGNLSGEQFTLGTHAHTGQEHIIYDQGTGNLWYDANGNADGSRVLIANFVNHAALTASDFLLVA